jgi:hypothetical protein
MSKRIDWWRITMDLQDAGYSLQRVADETFIPRSTLLGYRNLGAEPPHGNGEALLALWRRVMVPAVPVTDSKVRHVAGD